MSERPPFVLWLDLETAGTDEYEDPILEVGAVLVHDAPGMETVDTFSRVVAPRAEWWDYFDEVSEVVREMHDDNGLWNEARESEWPIDAVDDDLRNWMEGYAGRKRVALGGSGVSHFDRRFIRSQLPKLDKRLTYWAYDVGVVRRMLARVAPEAVRPMPENGKAHRGLADAIDHRDEWVTYESLLGRLSGEEAA